MPPARRKGSVPNTLIIWTGWAVALFAFQCIHFFFPINIYSVAPVFLLGISVTIGLLYRELKFKAGSFMFAQLEFAHVVTGIALLVIIIWVASRAMAPNVVYDSGLYHFNIIRWTNSFPIVPGLGNLHGRLAFNQSFFTYVAALNLYPIFSHGRSLANSFLLLLSFFTLLELVLPVLRRPGLAVELPPLQWFQAALGLFVIVYWALSSREISSPSPDLASYLLQLVIFTVFARMVSDFIAREKVALTSSSILILLAVTGVTLKLSNGIFFGVIVILVAIGILKDSRTRFPDAVRVSFLPILMVLVMCVRGVILSGAPFYPSTLGYVHTSWSVPVDEVVEMKNLVYAWARQPKAHWEDLAGNWNWLAPWLDRVAENLTDIIYPLRMFLALGIFTLVMYLLLTPKAGRKDAVQLVVLLPCLLGLVFWFFTAPDPRFAQAMFILLPIAMSVILLARVQKQVNRKVFATVICGLLVVCNLNFVQWMYWNSWSFARVSLTGWYALKAVPLNQAITKGGLRLYTPANGDRCWDAPVLCTPTVNENLRLIDAADMSAGFTVVPSQSGMGR